MVLSSSLAAAVGLVGCAVASPCPRQEEGFVTTNGNSFQLNGDDFIFAGSNGYYFPFSGVGYILLWYMPSMTDVPHRTMPTLSKA